MRASELRNQIEKMIEKYGDFRIVDEEEYERNLGISFCSGERSSMYSIMGKRLKRQDHFMMFGQNAEFCDGFSEESRLFCDEE